MKERLRKMFSILCMLMLLCSCLPLGAAADGDVETLTVSVVWNDENDLEGLRPTALTATLKVGDKTYQETLNAANSWTAAVAGVPGEGAWSVDVPEGYTKREGGSGSVTIFTLTHQRETVSVSVAQRWQDDGNARNTRPQSEKVRLLADGKQYASVNLNSGNSWKTTWKDLPKYQTGKTTEVVYTVEKDAPAACYASVLSGDQASGFVFTDTLQTGTLKVKLAFSGAPEDADFSGLIVVVSGADERLSKTLGYSDFPGGVYTLENALPGAYVAQEKNAGTLVEKYVLDGGSTTVGSANVPANGEGTIAFQNTYRLPQHVATPTPDPSQADLGELTFKIDGPDPIMPMEVQYSKFTNGRYEINGLMPGTYIIYETNAGTLIDTYQLTSNSTTGVAITVRRDGTATAKLFNQYEPALTPTPTPTPTPSEEPSPTPGPETVDIPVTKTWQDNNNKDGNRPVSVTVRLYADGVQVGGILLNDANGWRYTFTELAKNNEDGTPIVYTISEDPVEWYEGVIDGYHITNVYHPEVTSVFVRKVWEDQNNKLKLRPKSIHCTLYNAMGAVTTVVLSEENGWSASVSNLPTRVNQMPAVYTWEEQEVLGYRLIGCEVRGNLTTFTNYIWRPTPPDTPPNRPGEPYMIINEYGTPLGVEITINHVGDCFD